MHCTYVSEIALLINGPKEVEPLDMERETPLHPFCSLSGMLLGKKATQQNSSVSRILHSSPYWVGGHRYWVGAHPMYLAGDPLVVEGSPLVTQTGWSW